MPYKVHIHTYRHTGKKHTRISLCFEKEPLEEVHSVKNLFCERSRSLAKRYYVSERGLSELNASNMIADVKRKRDETFSWRFLLIMMSIDWTGCVGEGGRRNNFWSVPFFHRLLSRPPSALSRIDHAQIRKKFSLCRYNTVQQPSSTKRPKWNETFTRTINIKIQIELGNLWTMFRSERARVSCPVWLCVIAAARRYNNGNYAYPANNNASTLSV